MSLRYPILAGTRESNTTNHISLYNDHDEQDISGCSIDKDTTTTKDDNETVLPPELYAVIMEYLPFDDILSCAAVSRTLLHEAMPRLKTLHIDKASQINLTVASRFRDITVVNVNSLFTLQRHDEGTVDEVTSINIDMETKISIVPFLSQFNSLEHVHFGVKDAEGRNIDGTTITGDQFWEGEETYPNEGARESMLGFLDLLSGAFRSGALRKNLKVSGLCCPDSNNPRSNNCETCLRACKRFPLNLVASFDCEGSSIDVPGKRHVLDVCLERAQIESIIESRPNGHELLTSDQRLVRLLGRGRVYEITSADATGDSNKALRILKYKQKQLNEIDRVIKYAEVDVRKLSMQSISDAIMSSFALDYNSAVPLENQYISESSLSYLRDDLGLPLDEEYLTRKLMDLMGHIPKFLWVLRNGLVANETEDDDAIRRGSLDVEMDCLKLIRQYIESNILPVKYIKTLIPCLLKYLDKVADVEYTYVLEAAWALNHILVNGKKRHHNMIVDKGGVSSFSLLLDASPVASIAKVALLSLVEIDNTKDKVIIDSEEGIDRLVAFLESDDRDCVKSALQLLVASYIEVGTQPSLLPHLVRIMKLGTTTQSDMLANCLALLAEVLGIDESSTQVMIDLETAPCLVELIKTNKDHNIQVKLAEIIIRLFSTGIEEQKQVFVQDKELLTVFVNLTLDTTVAEKAMSTVRVVAKNKSHRPLLLEAGVVKPLLQVLNHCTKERRKLKMASSALSQCCCGMTLDFNTSRAVLDTLSNIIFIRYDEEVLCNACWALFRVLAEIKYEDIYETISTGFLEQMIKALPSSADDLESNAVLPMLKCLYLISVVPDCVNFIIKSNGTASISKVLSKQTMDASKGLACSIISNIIRNNPAQIQVAIDNNLVPDLARILTHNEVNRDHAVRTIRHMTLVSNSAQIKYMVSQGLIDQICGTLTADLDCNTALVALRLLYDILKVGKNKVTEKVWTSCNVQMVETKLEKLINDIRQIEHEVDHVKELQQKKAALELKIQSERVKTLSNSLEELASILHQVSSRLQLYKYKGERKSDSPLKHAYNTLSHKEEETKTFLDSEIRSIECELGSAQIKLERLQKETAALPEIQSGELLTLRVQGVNRSLETAKSNLESMKDARSNDYRRSNLDAIKVAIRELFSNADCSPTREEKGCKQITPEVHASTTLKRERLYQLVHQTHPEQAGKITGILLEMPDGEVLPLLKCPEALKANIQYALHVLGKKA